MNTIYWLQKLQSSTRNNKTNLTQTALVMPKVFAATVNASGLVYIHFPQKRFQLRPLKSDIAITPKYVAVIPPQKALALPADAKRNEQYQKLPRSPSPLLVSVFVLSASVLACTGILKMMILGFQWQPQSHAFWNKTDAVHKGGKYPQWQQIIENEYQHALVRDAVAASDTGNGKKEGKKEALHRRITITEESGSQDSFSQKEIRRLIIFNGSTNVLEQVTIRVEYFHKGGKLAYAANYETNDLLPQRTKTIEVPAELDIQFYFYEVKSKWHTTTLHGL